MKIKKAKAATAKWVRSGDRSHPNLRLIDEALRPRSTYPGHEDDLRKLEGFHFAGDRFNFDQTRHKIVESQRVAEGDRSHRRLVELDALCGTLTYIGREEDRERAEAEHLGFVHGNSFDRIVEVMKRKQAAHDGDRAHEDLRRLDSLRLSYPGWEADVGSAESGHAEGFGVDSETRQMTEKQRMFEGDRSHPRLVALDSLKLAYPGWKRDVEAAERQHLSDVYFRHRGVGGSYRALIQRLERKQREFVTGMEDTSTMHPIQREIVETHWTYPGFEDDIEKAKNNFHVVLYKQDLERCQLRQMIHDGDFGSHPALIKIDKVRQALTYPGCRGEVKRVIAYARDTRDICYERILNEKIQGMQNKQMVFAGVAKEKNAEASNGARSGSVRFLRRLSSTVPSRPRRGKKARQKEHEKIPDEKIQGTQDKQMAFAGAAKGEKAQTSNGARSGSARFLRCLGATVPLRRRKEGAAKKTTQRRGRRLRRLRGCPAHARLRPMRARVHVSVAQQEID